MSVRDIDLDVMNFGDKNVEADKDSAFWVRSSTDDHGAFIYYNGSAHTLVNAFMAVMRKHSDVYDIMSSAVALFEEDADAVIEDDKPADYTQGLFHTLNVISNAIMVEFAEITQMEFKGWRNNQPAGEAMLDDQIVKFSDIVFFVESGQPSNMMELFFENEHTDDFREFVESAEENSVYCEGCDKIAFSMDVDWLNDTQCLCPYCSHVIKV